MPPYLFEKSTVELDDVRTGILAHDNIQFVEYLFLRTLIDRRADALDEGNTTGQRDSVDMNDALYFHGHEFSTLAMFHLPDNTEVSFSDSCAFD